MQTEVYVHRMEPILEVKRTEKEAVVLRLVKTPSSKEWLGIKPLVPNDGWTERDGLAYSIGKQILDGFYAP